MAELILEPKDSLLGRRRSLVPRLTRLFFQRLERVRDSLGIDLCLRDTSKKELQLWMGFPLQPKGPSGFPVLVS